MHDDIIRYPLEGEIADTNIVQEKERLLHFVEMQMREDGVVPNLDLEPQFTLDYNPDTETYRFSLSVYGMYVGKAEACKVAGLTYGTAIQRHTPLVK